MSRRGNTAHSPLAFDQLRAKLLQRWLQSNQSILSNNVQNNPNHAFLNTITVDDSAIRSFPDVSLLMKISHFNMINDITNTNTAKCCLTGTVGLSNWQCFDVATFKKSEWRTQIVLMSHIPPVLIRCSLLWQCKLSTSQERKCTKTPCFDCDLKIFDHFAFHAYNMQSWLNGGRGLHSGNQKQHLDRWCSLKYGGRQLNPPRFGGGLVVIAFEISQQTSFDILLRPGAAFCWVPTWSVPSGRLPLAMNWERLRYIAWMLLCVSNPNAQEVGCDLGCTMEVRCLDVDLQILSEACNIGFVAMQIIHYWFV